MEQILAIDPGERVGWARARVGPDSFALIDQGVTPLKDFALKLGTSLGNYDTVIYETWRLYPEAAKFMIGNDMQPSQLVGMIRYISWLHPKVKLVSQGASIKTTALKSMPEYLSEHLTLSSEQHDQDAIMHAWFYHWERHVCQQA